MTHPRPPGPRVWKLFGSGLSGTWQVRQGPQVGDDDIYVDVVEEAELREAKAELEKHRWRQVGAQVDPTPEAYAALEAEVERLKAQDLTHAVIAADVKLREERDALAKEVERLREALEFYAASETYVGELTEDVSTFEDIGCPIDVDLGYIARQALSGRGSP